MKKNTFILFTLLSLAGCLASCDKNGGLVIAIPNDTTNEARALLLLETKGYITLKDGAGITATIRDIKENPYNLRFKEIEAAQIPASLSSVDYGIINSNYALNAKLNPVEDALLIEDSYSSYANVVAVKEGKENDPKIKALKAAIMSSQIKEFINTNYNGGVIATIDNPTSGFDETIDYSSLSGTKITIAASSTPHAEILKEVKRILSTKQINLDIREYDDYIQPNMVVESGEIDANYFQHQPYLDDFNKENKTHIVSICAPHVEPMGLYGGKQTSLDAIKNL